MHAARLDPLSSVGVMDVHGISKGMIDDIVVTPHFSRSFLFRVKGKQWCSIGPSWHSVKLYSRPRVSSSCQCQLVHCFELGPCQCADSPPTRICIIRVL